MADLRHQALRYFVAVTDTDTTECAECALEQGFGPTLLQQYVHQDRRFAETPESRLVTEAEQHLNRTGQLPGIALLQTWIAQSLAQGHITQQLAAGASAALGAVVYYHLILGDVETVVKNLREEYQRNTIILGMIGISEGELDTAPIPTITAALRRLVDTVEETGATGTTGVYTLAEMADKRWEEYLLREGDEKAGRGIMLGWLEYDQRNNGVRPGELLIVAANTSVGKSAFQARSALNAWRLGGRNVLLINKEMSARVQHQRMEAMELGTLLANSPDVGRLLSRIELGQLPEQARGLYQQLLQSYKDNPAQFWMVPPDAYTNLGDLEGLISRLKRKHGLDLVCADSLNLQTAPGPRGERHDLRLGDAVGFLKDMATRYDIGIITDAQSHRDAMGKREVSLKQAVGYSSMIVQHSDDVIRLFPIDTNFLEAQVLKSRNGETGYSFQLYFDGPNMRMEYVSSSVGEWK